LLSSLDALQAHLLIADHDRLSHVQGDLAALQLPALCIDDAQGQTSRAWQDATAPGVFYDPDTRTEYIKGSSTARDWYDDFTKIPFWGDTGNSERYQQATDAYSKLQSAGKPVDRVVGHSLGGSVALEMQSRQGIPKSRTFGAPVLVLNPLGKVERYRRPLDPVSILDRKAKWGGLSAYPHTYTGFTE
jgi:hypothetical protein